MSSRAKVFSIIAKVLDMSLESVHEGLTPKDVEKWDSLRHMTMLMAIEEVFGFCFSDQEMVSVGSVGDIVGLVERKLTR